MKPEDLPIVVDSTMLSTFRACEAKFRLEYVENLAPSHVSVDLHAGGAIAAGLEALYSAHYLRGLSPSAALGAMEFAFTQAWGDFEVPEWKRTAKTPERCLAALFSYAETYKPPHDHLAPYPGVDRPFEYSFGLPLTRETTGLDFPLHPSGDPFIYAGRFDALGLYLGLPCIRDDKTTSAFSDRWADNWTLRAQFMGYTWALRTLGIPIEAVIIRGICIQKTQIQHREVEKRYPPHLIDQWLQTIRLDLERIITATNHGWWQPSFGTECTAYSGCAFVDVCASPEPDRWKGDFARRNWNPLERGA